MITLIGWTLAIAAVLMMIGLYFSWRQKIKSDNEQINRQRVKVNYHSTTGTGSRR